MKKVIIAIDGPAASGKGTIARMLADYFHFAYLDSGKLYRAFAYRELVLSKKLDIPSYIGSYSSIDPFDFSSFSDFIDKIPDEILKSEEVAAEASIQGKRIEVREFITDYMRKFADRTEQKGIIIDGRDIGTAVFPNADCKIFLKADIKVRAERRLANLKEEKARENNSEGKIAKITFESVFEALKERDERDSKRKISPMSCDKSYEVLDNSEIGIQETFEIAKKIVEEKIKK